MLVDSHCHLDFPQFHDDLPALLRRAQEAGVDKMVTICTRLDRWEKVRELVEAHPPVYAGVGVHPHEAGEAGLETPEPLLAVSEHPKVVAIGESGLDYHYDLAPRDAQAASFRVHIEVARQTGLPLVVHARNADADMEAILRDETEQGGAFPCVLHCFSSGSALAKAALELGHYISISGIATFKSAEKLREILLEVPRERLLVETDSPYLAPVPVRGKTNEPAYVAHTARYFADCLGLEFEAFAELTTRNFHRLFSKVPQEGAR